MLRRQLSALKGQHGLDRLMQAKMYGDVGRDIATKLQEAPQEIGKCRKAVAILEGSGQRSRESGERPQASGSHAQQAGSRSGVSGQCRRKCGTVGMRADFFRISTEPRCCCSCPVVLGSWNYFLTCVSCTWIYRRGMESCAWSPGQRICRRLQYSQLQYTQFVRRRKRRCVTEKPLTQEWLMESRAHFIGWS